MQLFIINFISLLQVLTPEWQNFGFTYPQGLQRANLFCTSCYLGSKLQSTTPIFSVTTTNDHFLTFRPVLSTSILQDTRVFSAYLTVLFLCQLR